MAAYLVQGRGRRLSRLALAVVVGTLQSLVPATSGNIGSTFLRSLYGVLQTDDGSDILPTDPTYYYRLAPMTEEAWEELGWWDTILAKGPGALIRASDPAVLISIAGDGSGTGTGNLVQFDSSLVSTPEAMQLWIGVWWARGSSKTSNWKETYTLLNILRRVRTTGRFRGRYAFYFTDSTCTYHSVQRGSSKWPHLQELVRNIKLIAAEIGVILEVIHIPGLAMIRQGADPLSRGLWLAPDPRRLTPREELARLFAHVTLTPAIGDWILVRRASVDPRPVPLRWKEIKTGDSWHPSRLMECATMWTPPPRIAAQAIEAAVAAWVEAPLTTEALFVIPHICTWSWRWVHKALQDIGILRSGQR